MGPAVVISLGWPGGSFGGSGRLAFAAGVEDQFAEEFAGGGVDDADAEVTGVGRGLRRTSALPDHRAAMRRNTAHAVLVAPVMTIASSSAPLGSSGSADVNDTVDGPQHRLLFDEFPRRVRATFNHETVLDTVNGRFLHESNLLPVLYVPESDVRTELLVRTDKASHCPFKGDANYWSIVVGGRTAENAVRGYPGTLAGAEWLAGHLAFHWERMDSWFDEDEEVFGHLRDPFHRVDARPSSRHVVVRHHGEVLAETTRPIVVSENGLPNRFYVPVADVRTDLLTSSTTVTHCPYKGWASYWSLRDGSAADLAWSYERPFADASMAQHHLCFLADGLTTSSTAKP